MKGEHPHRLPRRLDNSSNTTFRTKKRNMGRKNFWFSPRYIYHRCRQLEGTLPQGPQVGAWITTGMRVSKGWGLVPESAWPYRPCPAKDWPPQEPPGIDKLAKKTRAVAYQRVRGSNECKSAIAQGYFVVACFQITNQWFSAINGIIELPSIDNQITKKGHVVFLYGYDNNKGVFYFQNSWGKKWGISGRGSLPYAYFDNYILESWLINDLHKGPRKPPDATRAGLWLFEMISKDPFGGILHVSELYDTKEDEYIGWAFAVCRGGFLDVEELYVKPAFRGSGKGNTLAEALDGLRDRVRLPLRLWITHADVSQENLIRVGKIAKHLSLTLVLSGVRWASLKAIP